MENLKIKSSKKLEGIEIVSLRGTESRGGYHVKYFTFGEGYTSETKRNFFKTENELLYWLNNI